MITQSTSFAAVLVASCVMMSGCGVKNPRLESPAIGGNAADVTFAVQVRKYEFEPSEIRVKEGQVVELSLVATDRKHGFELKPFGIRTELNEGTPVTVRFRANQRGDFEFRCIVFCGLGHLGMKGKLVVE